MDRVVWSEGMFLTPHHFQQWDRYHEGLLDFRVASLAPFAWGIMDIKLETEALANGKLAVSRVQAVMPDGLGVRAPDRDEPPAARELEPLFPPKLDVLQVYLAAPLAKLGSASVTLDGSAALTRFAARPASVTDENTGGTEREISVARKQLRILFTGEPLEDYTSIKIAEVTRTATGAYALKDDYAPPCLWLGGSAPLVSVVRKLLEVLATKSTDLAERRRQRAAGLIEFTMSEAANFWFLHTVNSFIPVLSDICNVPQAHPHHAFLALAQIAGQLMTFAPEGHPMDLPAYSHTDPAGAFNKLEQRIRFLLDTIIPTRCIPIPLERRRETLFTGLLHDDRVVQSGQFYLAVRADVPEDKVIREIPLKTKLTSTDRVDKLIAQALRGVSLRHLAAPPAEIPVQPGRQYFQLDRAGEHWEAIATTRSIAIYIPPEFVGLKIELMAVKE